jgi:hypothetical protein
MMRGDQSRQGTNFKSDYAINIVAVVDTSDRKLPGKRTHGPSTLLEVPPSSSCGGRPSFRFWFTFLYCLSARQSFILILFCVLSWSFFGRSRPRFCRRDWIAPGSVIEVIQIQPPLLLFSRTCALIEDISCATSIKPQSLLPNPRLDPSSRDHSLRGLLVG